MSNSPHKGTFYDKHKIFRSAPVVAAGWVLFTAGYLVEFQRFHPDLLFHPLTGGLG